MGFITVGKRQVYNNVGSFTELDCQYHYHQSEGQVIGIEETSSVEELEEDDGARLEHEHDIADTSIGGRECQEASNP